MRQNGKNCFSMYYKIKDRVYDLIFNKYSTFEICTCIGKAYYYVHYYDWVRSIVTFTIDKNIKVS